MTTLLFFGARLTRDPDAPEQTLPEQPAPDTRTPRDADGVAWVIAGALQVIDLTRGPLEVADAAQACERWERQEGLRALIDAARAPLASAGWTFLTPSWWLVAVDDWSEP